MTHAVEKMLIVINMKDASQIFLVINVNAKEGFIVSTKSVLSDVPKAIDGLEEPSVLVSGKSKIVVQHTAFSVKKNIVIH